MLGWIRIIFNKMNEEYSQNGGDEDNLRRGRPVEQEQKFSVDSGCDEIDILIVDYFSKFGIEDGLACELDEDEPRMPLIHGLCTKHWPQIQQINILTNISFEDLVMYIDYVSKSVDTIFCQEFCNLIMAALLSLNGDKEENAMQFLITSDFFSMKKFREAYQDKEKKKTKKIKKEEKEEKDKKIILKVSKNLKNEKKKNKKQEGWKSQMCKMWDEGMVTKQFALLFSCLKMELKKFVEEPEPFLSCLKTMIKELEAIENCD